MTTFQESNAAARSNQEDMKVRYTAKTHTSGGRRGGVSRSDDGRLDVKFSAPGVPGTGTNPEQLFAAGGSACFISADVAATKRAIALQDGPVVLVGHSYSGVVITEAGNDPKVVGLVYVAALAPSDGESVASVSKPFPPTPLGSEVRADAEGFLTLTPKGIAEDFAQDLPDNEKQVLTATQGPTAAAVFGATITTAAWKTKPSWCVIASNDRAVSPELEKSQAAMKATSITVTSSYVPMLSHPKEVADLIEQAAAKAGSRILPPQQ